MAEGATLFKKAARTSWSRYNWQSLLENLDQAAIKEKGEGWGTERRITQM
jgi:hypothetical protein